MALRLDMGYSAIVTAVASASLNIPIDDVVSRRKISESAIFSASAFPDGVEEKILHVRATDGYEIPVFHYQGNRSRQDEGRVAGAAVMQLHGGGLISGNSHFSLSSIAEFCRQTDVQLFSVDYRLAPEHPFPTALEDCWTVLKWMADNAEQLGVDKARIGVMGESAGGGLAAALTLVARDRHFDPPIARQILTYPMLNDTAAAGVLKDLPLVWSERDDETAWNAYLGKGRRGTDCVSALAAPARVKDVKGLPPLYMEVGQIDMFAPDDVAYFAKFVAAGIETEFHFLPEMPHGFDLLMPDHEQAKTSIKNRVRQLKLI